MYPTDGFNNTLLSKGWFLEMAPTVRMTSRTHVLRIREGVRGLRLSGTTSMTLSNIMHWRKINIMKYIEANDETEI